MPKAFDCTPHTSKQVANFYFTALGGDRFECKCGNKPKQKLSAGYNNLLVHVFSQKLSKGPTCYLEWIKPTSNIVERLNSRAKLIFGTSRLRLSPGSLEKIFFSMLTSVFGTFLLWIK